MESWFPLALTVLASLVAPLLRRFSLILLTALVASPSEFLLPFPFSLLVTNNLP